MNFNDLFGRPRLSCTAGRRMFLIHSNGDLSPCAALYYTMNDVIGNIMEKSFRESIVSRKTERFFCGNPCCIAECDAHHTIQEIVQKNGEITFHVGDQLSSKGLEKEDFCLLQTSLTSTCNFNCKYCCALGTMEKHKGKDLSSEDWVDSARFFVETFPAGNNSVLGGEPTIHPVFKQYVMIFLDAGWYVDVFTNLSLPKKIYDLIAEAKSIEKLFIVISPHPTDSKFSLDKMIESAQKLTELGVQYGYSFVRTPENIRIAEEIGLLDRLEKETKPKWSVGTRDVYSQIK